MGGGGGGGGGLGTSSASTYSAMMYKYFRLWIYCDVYAIMTAEWLMSHRMRTSLRDGHGQFDVSQCLSKKDIESVRWSCRTGALKKRNKKLMGFN